jgi:phage terminase large subunit-like protein
MSRGEVIPIIRGAVAKLGELERSQLVAAYEQYRTTSNEWIRRQIVDNNRIDILASVILGYDVEPFHFAMMRWQFLHPRSLQLAFRGAGKSTVCTVTKAIFYLCKNRDFTIVIGSESKGNAAGFLREIKGHLENNDRLIEIFGPFYDPHIVAKWDTHEIDVVGKKHHGKESSIMCTGIDASITSKHFDAAIHDDLAVEDNSRTEAMREKTKIWYYKTWIPLIKPADRSVPHRGEHHGLGTRQHPDDLYGWLKENELKGHAQEVPALDEHENSPYPKKYSSDFFREQRRTMGIILFGAQYQQDIEAMRGEVFQYDDCQQLSDADWPALETLRIFMGVDLAVGEKDKNDMFSMSVIGVRGSFLTDDVYIYLLDYYLDHLRAALQSPKVVQFYDRWKPIRVGIEINQYQDILRELVKTERPGMNCFPITTMLDKITRAHKIAKYFENKRVFFHSGGAQSRAIDHLVRFPNGKNTKDFFDSFDNAIRAARKMPGKKKERRKFGLL